MLKKAGIVVAAAAAGLLAVSPLAFAGSKKGEPVVISDTDTNTAVDGSTRTALVNVSDNEVNVPIQACGNDVPVNVLGVQVTDLTAALGLLGAGGPAGGDTEVITCSQPTSSGGALTQVIGS